MILRLLLSILFIHFMGCSHSQPKQDKKRAELHFKIGSGHLAKGNYPMALKELLRASRLDPKNPQIQNNLGLAFLVRNKYEKATLHMRKAVTLDPKFTDARNNLGRILIERGLYEEAIEELEEAAEDLTYSHPQKVWANLGLANYRQFKYKSALKNFKKALSIERSNCNTFNLYSKTLFELKKFSKAAESYDQTIRLCKKTRQGEPRYYGALSYFKIGKPQEAVARLEEVIKIYPEGSFVKKAKTLLKTIK